MKTPCLLLVTILLSLSCKTGEKAASVSPEGTATGKVSHRYTKNGCPLVVDVINAAEPLILIPKDPLDASLNTDGMEIRFNYTLLRMPQPIGCEQGIPAELTDISKK